MEDAYFIVAVKKLRETVTECDKYERDLEENVVHNPDKIELDVAVCCLKICRTRHLSAYCV